MADAVADGASAPVDRTKSGATRARGAARPDERKPNIFKRIWIFITQVVAEMRKVVYPSGEETWTYFVVVVVFVAAIMAFTGLLDLGFGRLNALIFG
ncbi:preprotein translocase subunit SecE [Actinomyces culturomici]|uniref:preprotein translocase subunit SecE n=1 Tax=Actinomyces culturomici TaxID=1926276 RepID=UPI000E20AC62|nr:preprotein translocase subunit SecE [Actinomyces culturomici]